MSDDHWLVYEALLRSQERGEAAVLATVVCVTGSVPRHEGSKLLVRSDGTIVGTVGGGAMEAKVIDAAHAAMADGKPQLLSYVLNDLEAGDPGVCGGTVQIFIEPISVPLTLLVVGIGHVGKAVAELGKWMGYRVIISDDRAAYCNPEYLPGMDDYVVCPPDKIAEQVNITNRTCIALVTRGLPVDLKLLPALLETPAPYIGLIGSRRRWLLTAKALEEAGVPAEKLERIHAPIGLELQAETPKEIAVSILAEIIMAQRGGTGRPMRIQANADEDTAP